MNRYVVEVGYWLPVDGSRMTEVQMVHDALTQALVEQLRIKGVKDERVTILPWDVEDRYGREKLRLADGQRAVGVHCLLTADTSEELEQYGWRPVAA